MRSFEFFRTRELMLPGIVFGATYSPGFAADLSTWQLAVDDEGNLFQDVESREYLPVAPQMVQHYRAEHRCYHLVLGRDALSRLIVLAEDMGFWAMEADYEHGVTDMGGYRLSVRIGEREHTVRAYAAEYHAHIGHQEMKKFMRLWDALHERAPFPGEA